MPSYNKRSLDIADIVNQEDSADEDYDDRAPGPSKSRSSRSRKQRGAPARKKRRRGYRGSDIDSEDDDIVSDEEDSFDDADDHVETNERGRPVRQTTKKAVKYDVDSDDEDDLSKSSSEEPQTPPPRKGKKLIITLKTGNTPARSTRNLRTRSGSYVGTTANSSAPAPGSGATRRSSRISHNEDEPVVALTNSGNHVEVIRAGSRDPEAIPSRAMTGGKGLKYPSKSTIDEEAESAAKEEEVEEELEIKASQHELLESDPQNPAELGGGGEALPKVVSDVVGAEAEAESDADFGANQAPATQEDADMEAEEPDDDEDEDVVPQRRRSTRGASKKKDESPEYEPEEPAKRSRGRSLRSGAKAKASRSRRRKPQDESSDFDPDQEQDNQDEMSDSEGSNASPRKDDYESSNNGRRSTRLRSKAASRQRSEASDQLHELAEEVADLKRDGRKQRQPRDEIVFEPRQRRGGKKPNYDLLRNLAPIEDEEDAAPSPSQRPRKPGAGSWQRSLFDTYGPFGGGTGLPPLLGGEAQGPRAQGGVDSDSSDDEGLKPARPVGGAVGMTPAGSGAFNLFAQNLNNDAAQATAGTPANLGKIKDKQALADADPLGVDQNVNFDSVGGLQGHIDQLKEMVALPLLYPEIFMRFKITPPRGVLFHGPPGTGKTLLARALATSVSSQGRKVTFYMRKGADALSKWVGEAERQLRLLFEEARKTQPSIIFFDEIDGLAPVRSSKQEQIHASIVSTLLALMDGMDGRGQVIVIGATNRPDSIDPALRRPGRFDREFYFPLPDTQARRAIIDIHTKGWDPPLPAPIKDELAELTKGYGGADLRALCTEAALNAVQRQYPQIYNSTEKLLIDPKKIQVTPKDFMISIKKMTPSSERSTSSGAAPLPPSVEPLLRPQLDQIERIVAEVLPHKKRLTALEEAQYEDVADGQSFGRERMHQAFEAARVFRPRLLIQGKVGMGQQYIAAALLHHFEGLHVQAFDLPTLLSDTTASPESTVIRLFAEVKMHKPSVIYIPNVHEWYNTVGQTVISTFLGLLRSIKPTDPVLLLGFVEGDPEDVEEDMKKELFGYSKKNRFQLREPGHEERFDFFRALRDYIRTAPDEFPDPEKRKKRQLEQLPVAPPEPEKPPPPPSKEELKAQKKRDRQTLNMLKIRLQPIMDQIRTKHKKFRTGVIDENQIRYLYDEADPGTVTSDLHTEFLATASFRPFEIGKDAHGVPGLVDQANGNFYYNLDSVTIEKRLSNGYYKRPKDFLADIKRLAKDAKTIGDEDRLLKANELLANVEVDIGAIELAEPALVAECERVYQRELAREREVLKKARQTNQPSKDMPPPQVVSNVPHGNSSGPSTTANSTGPILLGEPMPRQNDIVQRLAAAEASPSTSVLTNGVHPTTGNDEDQGNARQSGSQPHHDAGHEADNEGDTPMGGTESHPGTSHEKSNETQKTQTSSSFGNRESAQPRPFHSYTAPSQQLLKESGMSAPRSQTGPFTPMPAGSQPGEFQNDASTTQSTSQKKPSSYETDHGGQGQHPESGPNLYLYDERRSAGGSQIPSTQGTRDPHNRGFGLQPPFPPQIQFRPPLSVVFPSKRKRPELLHLSSNAGNVEYSSQETGGASSQPTGTGAGAAGPAAAAAADTTTSTMKPPPQASSSQGQTTLPPVPAFPGSATNGGQHGHGHGNQIQDLLNPSDEDTAPQTRRASSQQVHFEENREENRPNLVQVEEGSLDRFHAEITDKTSGLSVEQLEQVNSVLMDTLWRTRGLWDRREVLEQVTEAFHEVLADMVESGQQFGPVSWGVSDNSQSQGQGRPQVSGQLGLGHGRATGGAAGVGGVGVSSAHHAAYV
ncbi:TAT-binding protein-like protein 7, AAA ATPase [Exophiala dermatitidis]|nr:TAT-binding protein-like protein 7, AAA ATPase [Exophiala dermatitidis]KAJ4680147.1 TAT-binding protein-like protein 7, AAA ATPase [Exophiala dermatitidis]